MLFLPYPLDLELEFYARDFKYLTDFKNYPFKITDPDMLVNKKSIQFDLDLSQLPKSYKPGGRVFYQLELRNKNSSVSFS